MVTGLFSYLAKPISPSTCVDTFIEHMRSPASRGMNAPEPSLMECFRRCAYDDSNVAYLFRCICMLYTNTCTVVNTTDDKKKELDIRMKEDSQCLTALARIYEGHRSYKKRRAKQASSHTIQTIVSFMLLWPWLAKHTVA